jgi:SAM-dependent methyltransferase
MDDPDTLPTMSTHRARGGALGRLRSNPTIAHILSRLHGVIVPPLRWINAGVRALSAGSHHFQYKVEGLLRPSAEWFDHEIDVHWQWVAKQRSMFLERGVLNTLAIRPGGQILEMCCGDGFNAHRFYAERGAHVLAIDHNDAALRHARRFHARANVEYRGWDIRKGVPEGPFDNIIWDSAIHHFKLAEVAAILASVHRSLAADGVLSGYTVIEPGEDYSYARLRFTSPETLAEILGAELAHVAVLETPDALRRNLYFFASDVPDTLPFAPGVHRAPAPMHEPASSA